MSCNMNANDNSVNAKPTLATTPSGDKAVPQPQTPKTPSMENVSMTTTEVSGPRPNDLSHGMDSFREESNTTHDRQNSGSNETLSVQNRSDHTSTMTSRTLVNPDELSRGADSVRKVSVSIRQAGTIDDGQNSASNTTLSLINESRHSIMSQADANANESNLMTGLLNESSEMTTAVKTADTTEAPTSNLMTAQPTQSSEVLTAVETVDATNVPKTKSMIPVSVKKLNQVEAINGPLRPRRVMETLDKDEMTLAINSRLPVLKPKRSPKKGLNLPITAPKMVKTTVPVSGKGYLSATSATAHKITNKVEVPKSNLPHWKSAGPSSKRALFPKKEDDRKGKLHQVSEKTISKRKDEERTECRLSPLKLKKVASALTKTTVSSRKRATDQKMDGQQAKQVKLAPRPRADPVAERDDDVVLTPKATESNNKRKEEDNGRKEDQTLQANPVYVGLFPFRRPKTIDESRVSIATEGIANDVIRVVLENLQTRIVTEIDDKGRSILVTKISIQEDAVLRELRIVDQLLPMMALNGIHAGPELLDVTQQDGEDQEDDVQLDQQPEGEEEPANDTEMNETAILGVPTTPLQTAEEEHDRTPLNDTDSFEEMERTITGVERTPARREEDEEDREEEEQHYHRLSPIPEEEEVERARRRYRTPSPIDDLLSLPPTPELDASVHRRTPTPPPAPPHVCPAIPPPPAIRLPTKEEMDELRQTLNRQKKATLKTTMENLVEDAHKAVGRLYLQPAVLLPLDDRPIGLVATELRYRQRITTALADIQQDLDEYKPRNLEDLRKEKRIRSSLRTIQSQLEDGVPAVVIRTKMRGALADLAQVSFYYKQRRDNRDN